MTKVYVSNITALKDKSVYECLYNSLPIFRKEKADKLRLNADKMRCVGAWALTSYALSCEGITDLSNIKFTEKGKPYLNNCNIHFNISHSGEYVMCAVSNQPLGCDVEAISNVDLKIAEKYFNIAEAEKIFNNPEPDRQRDMFFRLWTLKESFMKAVGKGLTLKLNDFSVVINNGDATVKQEIEPHKTFYFKEYSIDKNYKFSCCSLTSDFAPVQIVDLNKLI